MKKLFLLLFVSVIGYTGTSQIITPTKASIGWNRGQFDILLNLPNKCDTIFSSADRSQLRNGSFFFNSCDSSMYYFFSNKWRVYAGKASQINDTSFVLGTDTIKIISHGGSGGLASIKNTPATGFKLVKGADSVKVIAGNGLVNLDSTSIPGAVIIKPDTSAGKLATKTDANSKLSKASNLSDVPNPVAARTFLGIYFPSTGNAGVGEVVTGDDTRWADTSAVLRGLIASSGGAANLDTLRTDTTVKVLSAGGTPALIKAADTAGKAGVMTSADKIKLNKIEIVNTQADLRNMQNVSTSIIYRLLQNKIIGDFYWDPSSTMPDDSIMSIQKTGISTGRFLRYYQGEVWVEWWGAKPDDGVDDTYFFQKMSNWMVKYSSKGNKMRAGAGVFNVTDWLWYATDGGGVNFTYVTLHFEGISNPYDGTGITNGRVTELYNSNGQEFLMGIQTGAGCSIRNAHLRGRVGPVGSGEALIVATDATWTQSGAYSNDQYSFEALILLDGINASVPVGHRYAGANPAWYNNTQVVGSSVTNIDNVALQNSIVGISTSTCPGITNGDNVIVNNCYIQGLKSFWVSGNTQSRGNKIERVYSIGPIEKMIDCVTYGDKNGTPPDVMDASFNGATKYLYDAPTGFAGMSFTNVYAEELWSLGKSLGNLPIDFNNCKFNIANNVSFHSPTLAQGGPVNFKGGFITYYDGFFVHGFIFNNQIVSFDGTTLMGNVAINMGAGSLNKPLNQNNVGLWNQIRGSVTSINGYSKTGLSAFFSSPVQPENIIDDGTGGRYTMVSQDKLELIATESHQLVFDSVNFRGYFRATNPALFGVGQFLVTDASVSYSNCIYSATRTALGSIYAISGDTIKLLYPTIGLNPATTYNIFIARQPQFLPRCIGNTTNGNDTIKTMIINAVAFNYPAVGTYLKGIGIQPGSMVKTVGSGYIVMTLPAIVTAQHSEFYDARLRGEFYGGHYDTADAHKFFYIGDMVYPVRLHDGLDEDSSLLYYYCTRGGIPGSANPPAFNLITGIGGTGSGVPTTRTITINSSTLSLATDRTWTIDDSNLPTSDITTNNASTSKHGFLPKVPGVSGKYPDGLTGAWLDLPAGSVPAIPAGEIAYGNGSSIWSKNWFKVDTVGGYLSAITGFKATPNGTTVPAFTFIGYPSTGMSGEVDGSEIGMRVLGNTVAIFGVSGSSINSHYTPGADNSFKLGGYNLRWSYVYGSHFLPVVGAANNVPYQFDDGAGNPIQSGMFGATNAVGFSVTGTERMRINSAGSLGVGTTSPDASSILDLTSTTQGALMPRMTTTQRNAISSPATGLLIYNTTVDSFQYRAGGAWQNFGSGGGGGTSWGSITGTLSSQSDLNTALGLKAPLASPALTGTPTAPTPSPGDNSTKIPTTAFVMNAQDYDAGLYTPTISGTTNVASSTPSECQWSRTKFNYLVSGYIDITPTAGSTTTTFDISLPPGISGFADAGKCGGSGGALGNVSMRILANTSTGNAVASFTSIGTSSIRISFDFHFSYTAP